MYTILTTEEYDDWLSNESEKSKAQIENRITNVELYGHFGTINDVSNSVWEFKWKSGRRIYYAYIAELKILLLLGGNKNGQSYDIKQAKKTLKNYQ